MTKFHFLYTSFPGNISFDRQAYSDVESEPLLEKTWKKLRQLFTIKSSKEKQISDGQKDMMAFQEKIQCEQKETIWNQLPENYEHRLKRNLQLHGRSPVQDMTKRKTHTPRTEKCERASKIPKFTAIPEKRIHNISSYVLHF